jgi:hypothetical protein
MMVSGYGDTIDPWKAVRHKEDKPGGHQNREQPSAFARVARDFEQSMETSQITVPFIMRTLPMMREICADRAIRGLIAESGERLDIGEEEEI